MSINSQVPAIRMIIMTMALYIGPNLVRARDALSAETLDTLRRKNAQRFPILICGLLYDFGRQAGSGLLFVPVQGVQVVPDKLLVEARRADTGSVVGQWPESR